MDHEGTEALVFQSNNSSHNKQIVFDFFMLKMHLYTNSKYPTRIFIKSKVYRKAGIDFKYAFMQE
jgi:hypothetical protein